MYPDLYSSHLTEVDILITVELDVLPSPSALKYPLHELIFKKPLQGRKFFGKGLTSDMNRLRMSRHFYDVAFRDVPEHSEFTAPGGVLILRNTYWGHFFLRKLLLVKKNWSWTIHGVPSQDAFFLALLEMLKLEAFVKNPTAYNLQRYFHHSSNQFYKKLFQALDEINYTWILGVIFQDTKRFLLDEIQTVTFYSNSSQQLIGREERIRKKRSTIFPILNPHKEVEYFSDLIHFVSIEKIDLGHVPLPDMDDEVKHLNQGIIPRRVRIAKWATPFAAHFFGSGGSHIDTRSKGVRGEEYLARYHSTFIQAYSAVALREKFDELAPDVNTSFIHFFTENTCRFMEMVSRKHTLRKTFFPSWGVRKSKLQKGCARIHLARGNCG